MDDVPGSAQLVGEREESGCLALGVVKEQDLGHGAVLPRARLRKS